MEWISVNERLPEKKGDYLVWIDCRFCRKGIPHGHKALATGYKIGINIFHWDGKGWPVFTYGDPNLTHWMEIDTPEANFKTNKTYQKTSVDKNTPSNGYRCKILNDNVLVNLKVTKKEEKNGRN